MRSEGVQLQRGGFGFLPLSLVVLFCHGSTTM